MRIYRYMKITSNFQYILLLLVSLCVVYYSLGRQGYLSTLSDGDISVDAPHVSVTASHGIGAKQNAQRKLEQVRICTQDERISHMKSICQLPSNATQKAFMHPAIPSLIDHKHKLMYCPVSKCANTALKSTLLEANGWDLSKFTHLEDQMGIVHMPREYPKFNVSRMGNLEPNRQQDIIKTYFKIISIRHPFVRLVSYYHDKVATQDTEISREYVTKMLRYSRPKVFTNKTFDRLLYPQTILGAPTFSEFIMWFVSNDVYDDHWGFMYERCHTCAHDWDAILRVETMVSDGKIFTHRLNSTHEGIPARHVHRNNYGHTQLSSVLEQFRVIPDDIMNTLLDVYRTDMTIFGYHWDNDSKTAFCSIETPDGPCC